ncbi:MAG: PGF-pre-PGF domain-containing protein [Methanoregula sp.]|nr:PGF-pre-PGF domain-containing protein [Methanoregula sp.]
MTAAIIKKWEIPDVTSPLSGSHIPTLPNPILIRSDQYDITPIYLDQNDQHLAGGNLSTTVIFPDNKPVPGHRYGAGSALKKRAGFHATRPPAVRRVVLFALIFLLALSVLLPPASAALAPTVTGITNRTGYRGWVVVENITGTNFVSGATARFNGTGFVDIFSTSCTCVSATRLYCTFDLLGKDESPTNGYNIVVTNPDMKEGMRATYFTLSSPAPTIPPNPAFFSPNTTAQGTTGLTITAPGTELQPGMSVVLNRSPTTITAYNVNVVSPTQVIFTIDIPAGATTGLYTARYTNTDGKTVTRNNRFTVTNAAPTVTGITPSSGQNTTTISITNLAGTGFYGTPTVNLTKTGESNITATIVSVDSATKITCTFDLTGKTVGAWNVTVINLDNQEGSLLGGFAVTNITPAPTFASATTNAAGTVITITFNKAMANPSGKEAQFTYKIGAAGGKTFSAAALNSDPTKIDLTTSGTAIAYGNTVTVSYTKGTVTAADTGVLESFTDQAVTNAMPAPAPPPDNGGSDGSSPASAPASAPASLAMLAPAEEASSTSEVNVGGNSAVTQVAVTGTGISDLIVTGTVVSGPGQDNAPPVGNVYEYMDITPARYTTIDNAVISFTVPVSWLEEHHLTPQDIIMNHQAGKTWNALPTTLVKIENGQAYYTAVSPVFSRFAITGEIDPAGAVQEQTPNNQTLSDMVQATTAPVVSTVAHTPIATQTTAAPPAQPAIQPSFGFPVMIIGVVGIIILIGVALLIRRWWIRRQNPALFRKYG